MNFDYCSYIIYNMRNMNYIKYIVFSCQIGIRIALPIVGGIYAGAYLDQYLSTGSVFLIFGTLLGVIFGVVGAYKLLSQELKK